jgi:AraC family transcriptional regulator
VPERQVEIRSLNEIEVIGVPHTGPYLEIGKAYRRLNAWLTANDLFTPGLAMLALYFDDPDQVAPEELKSMACVSMPELPDPEPPFVRQKVPGGRYAVLRHRGPYETMPNDYDFLLGEWLRTSGEVVRDGPMFELYFNTPMNAEPADLITDIHVPLSS